MNIREDVSLAPYTTLGVGGAARFYGEAHSEEDIYAAIEFAQEQSLPLYVLGAGSNILVPDTGVAGVVLKVSLLGITIEDRGDSARLIAGAGVWWEDVVTAAGENGLFGIENLAGIPGLLGGAVVQNIGAYGAEVSTVFAYAETIDSVTGASRRIEAGDAGFAYRTSLFKKQRTLIITRVALDLTKKGEPNIQYADLVKAKADGVPLQTPREVAQAVRDIRAGKFPQRSDGGTAGSFFKNPVVPETEAKALSERYAGLPVYPQGDGTVRISLAWLLDHVLALKGFSYNKVRVYEKQPLVIVAQPGANAGEVDALAREIAERVAAATGICIEREVETLGMSSQRE